MAATPSVALAARGSPVSTPMDVARFPPAAETIAGARPGLTAAPTVGPATEAPISGTASVVAKGDRFATGATSAARRLLPPHDRNTPVTTAATRIRERRIIEPTP